MLAEVSGAFPLLCWRKTNADPPELKRQEEGETSASEVRLQGISKKKIKFKMELPKTRQPLHGAALTPAS